MVINEGMAIECVMLRHDFKARWLSNGRFTTQDPKRETYYPLSPYAYCADNPVRNVDYSGKEPTPYEAALMSQYAYGGEDAYNASKPLKKMNWIISSYDTKIRKKNDANGFNSVLFEKTHEDGSIEYAYAYAGTNSVKDAIQSMDQLHGVSDQYLTAVINARVLDDELGNKELTFVGHSLGGGEAAAASMATGRKAITFNPAAITQNTINTLELGSSNNVFNYISVGNRLFNGCSMLVGGDPLYNLQKKVGLIPPGANLFIPTISIKPAHGIHWFVNHKW